MVTPLNADFWLAGDVTPDDLEFLQTHLFEEETPLTTRDLMRVWVQKRLQNWRESLLREQRGDALVYKPEKTFRPDDNLAFPALKWQKGKVVSVRAGHNPDLEPFNVLEVQMEDGKTRYFAAGLKEHALNDTSALGEENASINLDAILASHGVLIEKRLDEALKNEPGLVRIAGRWFPEALLVDITVGHLNLAEAILDMAGGEPLPTDALLSELDLGDYNPNLLAFSLNYALQEDPRFDEVGPAGQVLWCLRRLEPQEVQETPPYLRYDAPDVNQDLLTDEMRQLVTLVDDELCEGPAEHDPQDEVTISLIYPHWRSGTLPLSYRLRHFFPTAYESPRIRFMLVDAESGKKMPAWVVRERGYVFGLKEWYEEKGIIPGSQVKIMRGDAPGEVKISTHSHKSSREWIKTVLVGADGGVVFALLRQIVSTTLEDRMAIAVPDVSAIEVLWQDTARNDRDMERLVVHIMAQLTKLYPQGNIHAQELYAAVNVIRRVSPLDLLALMAASDKFKYVGDLYFRLDEALLEDVA